MSTKVQFAYTLFCPFFTGNLEFRTNPQSSPSCLGLANTLNDPFCVALEVQGPLVEGASNRSVNRRY